MLVPHSPGLALHFLAKRYRIAESVVDSIEGPAQAGSDWETFFMAKAKIVRKAAVKKVAEAAPPSVKPVKQTLTKSALINLLAEENEIPRKTAAAVYATLENLFLGCVHPRGVGEFVLPGLLKVGLRKVPARRAGTLVRNPATGEMIKGAAKPASVRVKIRALSKLKTAAGS